MKSFKLSIRPSEMFLLLALSSALVLSLSDSRSFAQTRNAETRTTSKWQWTDDGFRQRVEISGKAEFADDYTDVSSVSEGGFVRIEEDRNGQTRRLEVRRDAGKQMVRTYYVNGAAHVFDDNAKKWLAEILLQAVRQGSIDVDKRVQTLLRQRGVNGLLEEIGHISGDHGKRIYFEALIKNQSLSTKEREKVLPEVARQISSDYETANILKNTASLFLDDSTLSNVFFQTLETIKSDYERRGVLSSLLKRKNLSEAVLNHLLESAARISSDYEKATFLLEASNLYTADSRLRSAFLKTVETIKSDHERGRVLSALLRNKQISRL